MLAQIGETLLYLAIIITWIVWIIQWKFRDRIKNSLNFLLVLNIIATILLWITFILLGIAFFNKDYSFLAVFNNVNNSMSVAERISATWASRQGTMLIWGVFAVTFTTLMTYYLRKYPRNAITERALTVQFFMSALLATFADSSHPTPFATQTATTNGYGLLPSLLNPWQLIHPPMAFLSYAALIVPFSIGLAILSLKTKELKASKQLYWLIDIFMLIGWGFTSLLTIAGSIWAYEENWSGFWYWDPVEISSLIIWTTSVIYFHTKLHVEEGNLLRSFTAALGWPSVTFAAFIVRSGVLPGLHSYAINIPLTIVFGTLMGGTLLALFYAVRKALKNNPDVKDAIIPEKIFALRGRPNKASFLAFWALVLITAGNLIGLLIEIFNRFAFAPSVQQTVAGSVRNAPYSYYIGLNAFLLLLLVILMPFYEFKPNPWSLGKKIILLLGSLVISGLIFILQDLNNVMVIILPLIISTVLIAMIVNSIYLIKAKPNFKRFGIQMIHIGIALMILAYFATNSTTVYHSYTIQTDSKTTISQYDISIIGTRRIVGDLQQTVIQVYKNDKLMGNVTLNEGLYNGSTYWNSAGWIITPLHDLFFRLLDTQFTYIFDPNKPINLEIQYVQYANLFRICFAFNLFAVAISIVSMIKRRPIVE